MIFSEAASSEARPCKAATKSPLLEGLISGGLRSAEDHYPGPLEPAASRPAPRKV